MPVIRIHDLTPSRAFRRDHPSSESEAPVITTSVQLVWICQMSNIQ